MRGNELHEYVDQTLSSALALIATTYEELQNCVATWQKQKDTMYERVSRTCPTGSDAVVKLNIGGQVFSTTEGTLLSEKETFFWAMLHSGQWNPDDSANREYFVDRSPAVFSTVLEYLRTGRPVGTAHLTDQEFQLLQEDVDFYQISSFFKTNQLLFDPLYASQMQNDTTKQNGQQTHDNSNPFQYPTALLNQPLVSSFHQPLVRYHNRLMKDTSVNISNGGKTLNRVAPHQQDAYYIAMFADPRRWQIAESMTWRITATSTGGATGWQSEVGVWNSDADFDMNSAADENQRAVIGLRSGKIYTPHGQKATSFVEWQPGVPRAASFHYTAADSMLTIRAGGIMANVGLPKKQKPPVPVIWCGQVASQVSFLVETFDNPADAGFVGSRDQTGPLVLNKNSA
eukprot:TRINITY_DN96548_c0_g1_i1.p1 TRINITY_DN96548_c0_g1~~TRINITY_DN96548_c0_g1_i1.p1  ORF type:complete len:400 (+),score=17.10 TRINITY_DN96548_c0_g1_i1:73-1272(+)